MFIKYIIGKVYCFCCCCFDHSIRVEWRLTDFQLYNLHISGTTDDKIKKKKQVPFRPINVRFSSTLNDDRIEKNIMSPEAV